MSEAVAAEFLPVLSAATAERRCLIVSLHDVAPATQAASARILDELRPLGIRVVSLLVIPNYHRQGKSIDDPGFVSWLREQQADGHEVVIHGYFHERAASNSETPWQKLVTRVYTDCEGEFFDLEYSEAMARITSARDEFRTANLSPIGFIAPAWLLNAEGERAARDAGMQYTTRLGGIVDLLTGEKQSARSLVYSTRSAWRRRVSLAWNAALARGAEMREVVRLSIHPQDFDTPTVWQQICRLGRRFAESRDATTYRDWIAEQRINRSER